MKVTFDINRYKELLEKEKYLNQQNKSFFSENKEEFLELLSYGSRVQDQISYQRKNEYHSLISQYIKKVLTAPKFQFEFLKMEQEDSTVAKIITDDLERLAIFATDLKALEFSSLMSEISEISMIAIEFGPEEGISDQNFRKSVEKLYFKMQKFMEKEGN